MLLTEQYLSSWLLYSASRPVAYFKISYRCNTFGSTKHYQTVNFLNMNKKTIIFLCRKIRKLSPLPTCIDM